MRSRLSARRWRVSSAVLVAIAAVTAALLPTPAQAASGSAYVALGDSYSSGVGAAPYNAASGICSRSPRGYPALWAAANGPANFTYAACAGATVPTVLAGQLGALGSATSLVTITVGGNDVGFVPIVATCLLGTAAACSTAVSAAESIAKNVLPGALSATYAAIHAHAPNASIVVLGYPRLFETGASCGTFGMSQANRISVNRGAATLNAVLEARAEAAGATFVSVESAFTGHGICSSTPWLNGSLVSGTGAYHPNATGYAEGYLPALESVTG